MTQIELERDNLQRTYNVYYLRLLMSEKYLYIRTEASSTALILFKTFIPLCLISLQHFAFHCFALRK